MERLMTFLSAFACHILCHSMQTTTRTQAYPTDTQA
jgi:hypothetical protein